MAINIKWDCDLDETDDKCLPEYSFSRQVHVTIFII